MLCKVVSVETSVVCNCFRRNSGVSRAFTTISILSIGKDHFLLIPLKYFSCITYLKGEETFVERSDTQILNCFTLFSDFITFNKLCLLF